MSAFVNGTLVEDNGVMQTLSVGDGQAVPATAQIIKGLAHAQTGERYVTTWPSDNNVQYIGGRAVRPDGAQVVVENVTPAVFRGGIGMTARGETLVATTGTARFLAGIGVTDAGALLVSNAGFTPLSLFSGGAKGAWYDPSDYSTLFQDSLGQTPVTAVEQPVGLMLDKSQGLVLGSQLVTNGDNESAVFSFGSLVNADTLARATAPGGGFAASFTSNTSSSIAHRSYDSAATLQAGRNYIFSGRFYVPTGGIGTFKLFDNGDGSWFGVSSTVKDQWVSFSVIRTAKSLNWSLGIGDNVASVVTSGQVAFWLDDLSIRELPGNHASQSTAASRPVLRARYNLLTYSEQFDNAAWTNANSSETANAGVAPDGTTTADKLIDDATAGVHSIRQTVTVTGSTRYTLSFYAKAAGRNWVTLDPVYPTVANNITYFDLSNGTVGTNDPDNTASITDVGNGWYRCQVSHTTQSAQTQMFFQIAPANANNGISYTGNGTDGVLIWGADLRTGSSAGTYQRIAAATDYATAGFLPYLAFDGTDDSFGTGSIDFSATDKMSTCIGMTKLSDAVQIIQELSANSDSNAGVFYLANVSTSTLRHQVAGSPGGASRALGDTTLAINTNAVVTQQFNIAGASVATQIVVRQNGVAQTLSGTAGSAGTGNFGNYPLYIGRRNNASFPLNGRIYQLIVCGKTLSASELASTESFVATKTGVTL